MPNALAAFGLPLHNLASASLLSCVSVYYLPRPLVPAPHPAPSSLPPSRPRSTQELDANDDGVVAYREFLLAYMRHRAGECGVRGAGCGVRGAGRDMGVRGR